MLGCGVTEMIQGISIIKQTEGIWEDLCNVIFAHPTVSEIIHEATLQAKNKAIHN